MKNQTLPELVQQAGPAHIINVYIFSSSTKDACQT